MFSGWLRRPAVADLVNASNANKNETKTNAIGELKRVYTLVDLIFFGLCSVVGSGIYVMAGTAGKEDAGSALLLAFPIGFCITMCNAVVTAEFASFIPLIGNAYVYLSITCGEIIGFIAGFSKLFQLLTVSASNVLGACAYLKAFLDIDESLLFGDYYLYSNVISINIIAPCMVFIFACIVWYDISLSSMVMNTVATFNMMLLILFGICGLALFDYKVLTRPCDEEILYAFNYTSCPSNASNSFFPYGAIGILRASLMSVWAFGGTNSIVAVGEETINPLKNIPKAIFITLSIVLFLYFLVTLSLMGMVPFYALDDGAALSEAFRAHNETLIAQICAFGAFTTMAIYLLGKMIAAPRYFYRMGLDGLICNLFTRVHPVRKTPINATIFYAIITMLISMFFDLRSVLQFGATLTMLDWTLTTCGTLVLRYCPPANTEIYASLFWDEKKIFSLIASFFIMCIFTAFIAFNYYSYQFVYVFIIIACFIILIQICIIVYLDKYALPWKSWIKDSYNGAKVENIVFVPFSPYLQCVAVIINSCLLANAGFIPLLQVLVILIVAFIVYITYGYKNSKFGNKEIQYLLEMK